MNKEIKRTIDITLKGTKENPVNITIKNVPNILGIRDAKRERDERRDAEKVKKKKENE